MAMPSSPRKSATGSQSNRVFLAGAVSSASAESINLCDNITFIATPPDDGAFVEYVAWPADFVYTLPESVSTAEGALCEPLGVGIHASRQAGITSNDTVLATGAGPIGMVAMEAAHAAGAGDIYMSDVVGAKLDRAEQRGAAGTIDVTEQNLADAVEAFTDGRGVDKVIEASGGRDSVRSRA